jgi:general secretion pathway protein B
MSYILDALNKSEEEKKQHKTPGLNTIHLRADRNSPSNNRWLWPTLGVVLVVINLLFIFWFSSDNNPSGASQNVTAIPVETGKKAVKQQPQRRQFEIVKPTQRSGNVGFQATSQEPPSTFPADPSPQPTRTSLPRPPEGFLSPDITVNNIRFSSHIYAEDSSLRMVVINGKRFREGDQIAKNLKLQAISEEGVIVRQRNQLIPISVLSNWADD